MASRHIPDYGAMPHRRSFISRVFCAIWLPIYKCLVVVGVALFACSALGYKGMPHLRVEYSYSGTGAYKSYISCRYQGWNSVKIMGGPSCPIIAFIP